MKSLNNDSLEEFFSNGGLLKQTELCEIIKRKGSDKCSDWHNYSPLYHFLFSENRKGNLNIFEVGIYGGASVRSWNEYFINSKIYCGDVNPSYFINEENIMSFFCDQDNPESIRDMWNSDPLKDLSFDIIIDDGKHEFPANINFLENSYSKLKEDGIFIIEDLTVLTLNLFKERIQEIKNSLEPKFIQILEIANSSNHLDNNILLIQK
jgi:SAM-dependent methyltransferase